MQARDPRRVAVEGITPDVDCGRYAAKRVAGDDVVVEADVFTDGHNLVAAIVEFRHASETEWHAVRMEELGNDRHRATFPVDRLGHWHFRVVGWPDELGTWEHGYLKKLEARQDVTVDREEGALLLEAIAKRAPERAATTLNNVATRVRRSADKRTMAALHKAVELTRALPDRERANRLRADVVGVGRPPARTVLGAGTSCSRARRRPTRTRPGTLADVDRAPALHRASWASTSLYLPPIHPIGTTHRKGAQQRDRRARRRPGQPVGDRRPTRAATPRCTPSSGTLADVERLVEAARRTASRSRSTSRSSRRPTIRGCASTRVVPPPARRHDRVRREPAEEVRGHLPARLRLRGPRRRCGTRCSTSSASGSTAACASSASTTRTPSRSRSGSG